MDQSYSGTNTKYLLGFGMSSQYSSFLLEKSGGPRCFRSCCFIIHVFIYSPLFMKGSFHVYSTRHLNKHYHSVYANIGKLLSPVASVPWCMFSRETVVSLPCQWQCPWTHNCLSDSESRRVGVPATHAIWQLAFNPFGVLQCAGKGRLGFGGVDRSVIV